MLLTRAHGTLEAARACSHSLAPSIASSPWLHSCTYALATRQASFCAVPQSRVHCRTCSHAIWLTQVTATVHYIGVCKVCLMECNLLLALSIVSSAIVNMNSKAVYECIIQSLAAALFDECGALMVILRHDTEE